jgi:hypothetical protein
MNVLFIGNSYTFCNDMPQAIFLPLLQEALKEAHTVTSCTKGGHYLYQSAEDDDIVGEKVVAALAERKWDAVILQEQSTCPVRDPETFFRGVRLLNEKIRKNGATPYLYGTWGRKPGSPFLAEKNMTQEEMSLRLAAAYAKIGAEVGAEVAQTSFAYLEVYQAHKDEIELFRPDFYHPEYPGSFLSALCLVARLTGVDPTTLSYCGENSPEVAMILKQAAKKAVFETPEIPEEYFPL